MTMPLLLVRAGIVKLEDAGAGLLELWVGVWEAWLAGAIEGVCGWPRVEGGRSETWELLRDMTGACGGAYWPPGTKGCPWGVGWFIGRGLGGAAP